MHDNNSQTLDYVERKVYICNELKPSFMIQKYTSDLQSSFHIRPYGIGELARLYSPHITVGAARRKLMLWIALQPSLTAALRNSGFCNKVRSFTSAQVQLIVEALGEP